MYLEEYGLSIEAIDEFQDFNKIKITGIPINVNKLGDDLASKSFEIRIKLHGVDAIIFNATSMKNLGYFVSASSRPSVNMMYADGQMSKHSVTSLLEELLLSLDNSAADIKKVLCLLKNTE